MSLPNRITMNAWTGEKGTTAVEGQLAPSAVGWSITNKPAITQLLMPPPVADMSNWRDPQVGWGLILPDTPGLADDVLASGADAPEPIRHLLQSRPGSPVFRYGTQTADPFRLLRNYKEKKDLDIAASPRGTATDAIPHYLLIYGGPDVIPWRFQYILNTNRCVGRLDLQGDALANYITALISNWSGSTSKPTSVVIWATNYGGGDITELMDDAIARPVGACFQKDPDFKSLVIEGTPASGDALIDALATSAPGLVVTTSHGLTGPLDKPDEMKAGLGLLVDSGYRTLDLTKLGDRWRPGGAIWYAHACCSAGCDGQSHFANLFDPQTPLGQTLAKVAAIGPLIAPLPRALLGDPSPLRAFVGHVEPTFDWTLKQTLTGQYLTDPIRAALYNNLYNRQPIGQAFRDWYARIGTLLSEHDTAYQELNAGANTQDRLIQTSLTARDIGSTVILGDPTAMIPI